MRLGIGKKSLMFGTAAGQGRGSSPWHPSITGYHGDWVKLGDRVVEMTPECLVWGPELGKSTVGLI